MSSSAKATPARASLRSGGHVSPPRTPRPGGLALVRPGPIWGPYPQRDEAGSPAWQRWGPAWEALVRQRRWRRDRPAFLAALRAALSTPTAPTLPVAALRARGFAPDVCAQALAHLAPIVEHHLGYRPHEEQHLAAWTMLQGCLVEMATGEGKTLATFLAAACAGLAAVPVHVLTANDYLARRDAETMAPLFEAVGLRVSFIVQEHQPPRRRQAYAADVTYASAKELAFDHLRDRLAAGRPEGTWDWSHRTPGAEPPLLRGLCLALLDEADNTLCDEARVPLILAQADPIAAGAQPPTPVMRQLLDVAACLQAGVHFRRVPEGAAVVLRSAGREWLAQHARQTPPGLPAAWQDQRWREDWTLRALTALHGLVRDRDYVVADDQVVFVDPLSGRAAPQRQWSRGLQQLLAVKEGLAPPPPQRTLAQMTYQRLFRRYHLLGGMSGTLREVRLEMAVTYGTPVIAVPRHHRHRLADRGLRIVADAERQWDVVARRVAAVHAVGRPVLVGTSTVAESEHLASLLRARGLGPLVLNAVQDKTESLVISRAGQPGRIVVSTQMAGRGTDIRLDDRVRDAGGLHVIACGTDHNARQWRQLIGRAARQGDPGSCETVLHSAAGPLVEGSPAWLRRSLAWRDGRTAWARAWLRLAMQRREWRDTRTRRRMARTDRTWAAQLAFTGVEA